MKRRISASRERRGRSPIWLTIYSDMMTNLTLFFLMMFAVNRLKTDTRDSIVKTIEMEFAGRKTEIKEMYDKQEEIKDKAKEIAEKEEVQKIAQIKISEERIKIMLRNPVMYDPGEAELKPAAFPVLHEIAGLIRDIPNTIIVEGHTDNRPIHTEQFRSNWELSAARAFSVVNYFVKKENLPPQRLSAVGYGEHRPLYPNDTEEHRAANRRIEINIVNIP